jgi:hypothetical protein
MLRDMMSSMIPCPVMENGEEGGFLVTIPQIEYRGEDGHRWARNRNHNGQDKSTYSSGELASAQT